MPSLRTLRLAQGRLREAIQRCYLQPEYSLAPVYDMLPMSLAPRPSGQIPDALPMPKVGVNPSLAVWKEMLPLAIRYWRHVAEHSGVADDVKQMAQNQADILSRPLV